MANNEVKPMTESQWRNAVFLAVGIATTVVLGTIAAVLLIALDGPNWALNLTYGISGFAIAVIAYVGLRREGVSRGKAGFWGAVGGSPFADLLWFMKDPEPTERKLPPESSHDQEP